MVQLKIADGMDGGCFHLLMENSCYSLVCFDYTKMSWSWSNRMLKTMIQRIYLMKRCLISNIAIIIGRTVFHLFVNISKKVYSWSGSSKISLYFHYIMFVLLWKYHGVCFVGHHCGKRHSIVEKIILKKHTIMQ